MEQEGYFPACGIDVHKELLVACIYTKKRRYVTRSFDNTTPGIRSLIAWIKENECEMTTMESTGAYWYPLWNLLEEEDLPRMLVNAQSVKAVPGKKTDKKDARWLAQLTKEGHVQASFVPDRHHREIRRMLVDRDKLKKTRAQLVNRQQKIMEFMNVKLSSVVSDVRGKSARFLMEQMIKNGAPTVEQIRQWQIEKKISRRLKATPEELCAALDGVVRDPDRFELQQLNELIQKLEEQIAEYTQFIATMFDERELAAIKMLTQIPGIAEESAMIIVGIIGTNMDFFPTAAKICAWAGVAPGNNESAKKRKPCKTTKGHKLLRATLVVCAHSAAQTKHSFFGARRQRLVVRLGKSKTAVAIAHSLLRAIWHILRTGEVYTDLGEDYYAAKDRKLTIQKTVKNLRNLGMDPGRIASLTDELEQVQAKEKADILVG